MSENNTNEDSMESHSPSFSEPTELKRGCDNCCKVSVCKSYLTTAMFEQQFIEDNKNIQKPIKIKTRTRLGPNDPAESAPLQALQRLREEQQAADEWWETYEATDV